MKLERKTKRTKQEENNEETDQDSQAKRLDSKRKYHKELNRAKWRNRGEGKMEEPQRESSRKNMWDLNETEKDLMENFENSDIGILAITETTKKGKRRILTEGGHLLIFGGVEEKERARAGVACVIKKEIIPQVRA
ncbi:hypothetical protein ILUMI_08497 [Ignelater luminosus]|uniref:Uncharacterized protein n=1 Tax=Ignelater luminosus TaxID=2038154 RepID=A0A8K0D1I8_IGNLU|nr:hypothetical protein ILUMI_08497 [Ignelater luminosus]